MSYAPLAILGAGNMGSALLGGLVASGYPKERLWITDPDEEKLARLKLRFQINTTTDNAQAACAADILIFAVKPQHLSTVAREVASTAQTKNPLILSIAAGIRLPTLQHWLGQKARLIRCMPNTPALIGCGASALFAGQDITAKERALAESLLSCTGLVLWVDEEAHMDAVTALSGSGPAYFFYILNALEKSATDLGLPVETAHRLAIQTALGAARMAAESSTPVSELQRQVTSKGGTTEAAIRVFDQQHMAKLLAEALAAAHTRSIELAESFDE